MDFYQHLQLLVGGGIARLTFVLIPISFAIFWLVKVKNQDNLNYRPLFNYLIFYAVWFISSILFGLFFGHTLQNMLKWVFLGNTSLASGVILLFLVVDFILIKYKRGILHRKRMTRFGVFYTVIVSFVFALFLSLIMGWDLISLGLQLSQRVLDPFGAGRVGVTVAENAQPYLTDWFSQVGKTFFWLAFLGMTFVGIEISKGIGKQKNKFLFAFLWALMIAGILFSRVSPTSVLNGENIFSLSGLFYLGGLILFLLYCGYLYFTDTIKIKPGLLIIAIWVFSIMLSARGAVRLLFAATPVIAFMACFAVVKGINYAKKSKGELSKLLLWVLTIVMILGLLMGLFGVPGNANYKGFIETSATQAKFTGPSAGYQWQNAMAWVRENTNQGDLFVHWWDYGYWVQYLGQRPALTDGGHANGYWDHLIGRYVLTTPQPETALSLMKAQEVSYLLIDPTDIGKYPAYSSIGSDAENRDRYSFIATMGIDNSQTAESSEGLIRVYPGGVPVDEDIIYEQGENQIFLPQNKAYLAAILITEDTNKNFAQPYAVFVYNQQQTNIPLRYLYFNGKVTDFGAGLDATVYVVPRVVSSGQNAQIDQLGGVMYLSERTTSSLFAQLYLFNNQQELYKNFELVHSEHDPNIENIRAQGVEINEIALIGSLTGPIKIWKVNYPNNVIAREEFLREKGEYAEFDNLQFIR
ncbi:hypothetical protein ACFLZJ_00735 [Nanoarchaeota archaeon]